MKWNNYARPFAICLSSALTVGALSQAQAGEAETDQAASGWSVFRGDSGLRGVAQENLKSPLGVAWTHKMEGPVTATAAIGDGMVFIGSEEGDFAAIDLEKGEMIWEKELGAKIESTACYLDGKVYVGSDDSFLYALEGKTGEEIWKFGTEGEILGGVNYLKTDDKTYIYVGSYDNRLYCVDATTGEKVWSVETNNYINGTPAVADGKVIFGGCDSVLYMADALTGESHGEIAIDAYIANSVAVDEGVLYTAHYGNQVSAYKMNDKTQVWNHHDRDFPYFASPAVTSDRVYAAGRGKRLYALDKATGKVVWEFRARRSMDSSPVISGELLYIGSDDGSLYAINTGDGTESWSYEIGEAITASPAIAGARLVIGAQDGTVYAFESQ